VGASHEQRNDRTVSQRARTRPRPEAAEVGMPSERQVLFWLACALAHGPVVALFM